MGKPRLILAATTALLAAVTALPADAYPRPGTVSLVSVATDGTLADKGVGALTMTPDGRFVAFDSFSTNLVRGDLNGASDVFVRDLRTRSTTRVSVDSAGRQGLRLQVPCTIGAGSRGTGGLSGAGSPAISADGRYVAFVSCFANLVTPAPLYTEVYVHDVRTGRTVLASVNDKGEPANSPDISPPAMSANGRFLVFASTATNLAPATCQGNLAQQTVCTSAAASLVGLQGWRVYRRDMVTGKTTVVSLGPNGVAGDGDSYAPFISPSGRYVGFISTSDNLTSVPANQPCLSTSYPACPQLYLRDVTTGKTQLLTIALNGRPGNGPVESGPPVAFEAATFPASMSANDRYVVFLSTATDLVPQGPLVTTPATYVRDLVTGRTEQASVTSTGDFPGANGDASHGGFTTAWPVISPDGRYVGSGTVCSRWYNQTGDWIHDRVTGATVYAVPSAWGSPVDCSSSNAPAGTPDNHLVLGSGAQFVAFAGIPAAYLKGSTSTTDERSNQLLLANRGPSVGTGGLAASGKLTVVLRRPRISWVRRSPTAPAPRISSSGSMSRGCRRTPPPIRPSCTAWTSRSAPPATRFGQPSGR
jgi:Tol biopolymer transport system component